MRAAEPEPKARQRIRRARLLEREAQTAVARALWVVGPGEVALRPEPAPAAADDAVVVRGLYSGISRGTEALVLAGHVPQSEWARMRCPFQAGDFPFPVKYGYAAVGVVEDGPAALRGREVFCLHPHQDRFAVPAAAVTPLPDGVPVGRAVLAANMETALNIVWDAGVGPGDRVVVIGAGVVGCLAAYLAARIPGVGATLVDLNPARRAIADSLGVAFAAPAQAPTECDVVIHASASEAGLQTAVAAAGFEATIVEASWYGDRTVTVALGGSFHSKRLKIVSSQVGAVSPGRRARWSYARRMAKALDLLADPRLDALISGETAFDDLARDYARVLGEPDVLCHRIRY